MSEKEKSLYGEGVCFERIRRITGYLVGVCGLPVSSPNPSWMVPESAW